MADEIISAEKLKAFWSSQVNDDEKWAFNMTEDWKILVSSSLLYRARYGQARLLNSIVLSWFEGEKLEIDVTSTRVIGIMEPIEPRVGESIVYDAWKLLRAAGLFAGSIFLMRNFGDLMAI
ncbi:hypothetical protein RJ641_014687 [Dillenia turbinata]|uniref:Uncharacterized protein n=1 Tax=Dillenia turbinata TaxID=194707 RepID=A0AAN8UUP8_9MAGN